MKTQRRLRVPAGGLRLLVFACSFFAVLFCSPDNLPARSSRDLVVVIDVSTSMLDRFDRAKAEAKQFVSSAQLGDRVTVITFGRTSHLLERTRIDSSYDIAAILSQIDELNATEFSTNLPSGMERSLEEMRRFYEEDPDAQRILMWLSDGKHNPPKDIPNLITFKTLKQRESGRLPDHNWFVFDSPIEPEKESDMQWFVDWAKRIKMHLKVELFTDDLGTLFTSGLEKEFAVRFEPDTQAAWGTSFQVVGEVTDLEDEGYSASAPVTPPIIVCSDSPWEETFRVTFPDRPGDYRLKLSFVLPSSKMLEISPPQAVLSAKVQQRIRTADRQAPAPFGLEADSAHERAVRDRPRSQTAFAPELRAELSRDASRSPASRKLIFGPVVAGGQYRQSVPLFPTREIPLDSIRVNTNFELPEGLTLEPGFQISDGALMAELRLDALDTAVLDEGWDIRGTISFASTENDVSIAPARIPVRFYTKTVASRWGRRMLPEFGASQWVGWAVRFVKAHFVRAAMFLVAALLFWIMVRAVRKHGFGVTELVGVLETVQGPNGHARTFNLRRLGRFKSTNSLTIGSGGRTDVVLPHPSVDELHAKVTSATTDAGPMIFIQPYGYNQVSVNGVPYSRRKEVGNGDSIAIGEFVLRYRCPEMYKETLLQFSDGTHLRGALVTWDIDSPSFEFIPKGAPSIDARMTVEFSELKTVSFVRKPAFLPFQRLWKKRKPAGRPVEVLFGDGELLEGYMVGEASEWSKRFYLVPKETGETALVLVERSAVQTITTGHAFSPAIV